MQGRLPLLLVDAGAPRLRAHVASAKHGVEQKPSSWHVAGTITGGSITCHGDFDLR